MLPTFNLLRGVSILALGASAVMLGACATEKPVTAQTSWNFPGETQATASTKPLMRLATLPMNPAPPAPYADYTEEPTRFIFRPTILFVFDEETGQMEEEVTGGDADMGGDEVGGF